MALLLCWRPPVAKASRSTSPSLRLYPPLSPTLSTSTQAPDQQSLRIPRQETSAPAALDPRLHRGIQQQACPLTLLFLQSRPPTALTCPHALACPRRPTTSRITTPLFAPHSSQLLCLSALPLNKGIRSPPHHRRTDGQTDGLTDFPTRILSTATHIQSDCLSRPLHSPPPTCQTPPAASLHVRRLPLPSARRKHEDQETGHLAT